MAIRFDQPVIRRSPLPLTERDEADLALLRGQGPTRAALSRLTPGALPEGEISEAMLLHAVFEAGLRAVRDAAEEEGYAQLAADRAAETGEHRDAARRRRPAWADEA